MSDIGFYLYLAKVAFKDCISGLCEVMQNITALLGWFKAPDTIYRVFAIDHRHSPKNVNAAQ
ncbi:hypothetical protein IQ276_033895 [Desmonostoc muscorum LEGE 12446]|uniref:Uncharacterized protein n=1 Tax=Desmonostoc muscorum LEGE 12446 TaxID=1828758 RepID=A0A8J7DBY9_DESMC|nr:hypothetical protein [Desmonostoc muscorum]MCF2151321.1 hypothetical protein [Desmonostoc muscorum LEGE 12446]